MIEELSRVELVDMIDSLRLASTKGLMERNIGIVKDRFISGMTYRELGSKYGISVERCRQIVFKCVKMIRYRLTREV